MKISPILLILTLTGLSATLTSSLCAAASLNLPIVPGMEVVLYGNVTDPISLSFAPDGTLYTGRDNSGSGGLPSDALKINRVGPCGSPVTQFGNSTIRDPDAVVFDAAGIVSGVPGSIIVGGVESGVNGRLSRIAPDGTVTSLFGPTTIIENPTKFIFTAPGRLLFADYNNLNVMVMTNATPQLFFATPDAPYSLALDGLGRVLVSSGVANQVWLYSAAGVLLSNVFVTAQARSPLARGPGGVWGTNVYFVATNGNLRSVSPAGVVTEHGTGFAPFEDMEFGPDGALYLSDLQTDCVLRVTPPGYQPVPSHWWRGDGDATNSTGTEHGTATTSVTYMPGRFGQAFRFNGTFASQVTFGTIAGNFGTNDFTVGLWIKTANSNALHHQFLVKRVFCGVGNFWTLDMAGSPFVEMIQDSLANRFTFGTYLPATAQMADAQWHHLALVRRGGEGFLYRDAVLVGSKATNFVVNLSNAALLTLNSGVCEGFGPSPLNGLLDEIKLYGCALTASQIAASAGLPDPTLPRLNIARLPNAVRLSWTTNAPGYLLETNSALTLPANWGVLASNYGVLNTNYAVTNAIGGAAKFYRLHKP